MFPYVNLKKNWKTIIPIIISILIPTVSLIWQAHQFDVDHQDSQQKNEQNDKKLTIMNDTLNYMKQTLVKSSFVYAHVQPHTAQFHSKSMSLVISNHDSRLTQGVTLEDGPLVLMNNETAVFDIVIYNAGSNVSFINSLSVNLYVDSKNITVITLPDILIQKPLIPNTGVLNMSYSFVPSSKLAPSGKLEFVINHDAGIYKYQPF